MKLHFESDLTYQKNAITSVCDLFEGQEKWESEMTVLAPAQGALSFEGATGSMPVNPQIPEDDVLLKNLNNVQLKNQLPPSPMLDSHDFTVEMETGTGKTYVYLRTMLELNKRYGMSKFIIVVPSVAIKEGVYKTLQITEEHFKSLYAGVPYEYYLYDSAKPADVRNFATSSVMQIMVMTVGAINKKDVNKLYQSSEKTTVDDLDKPIDLIRATRPIIIVDEPQSVDGGLNGAGKTALEAMHPMFTLRYSATHVHKHHMVYRLDAIDAYNQKLVKQIEVAGLEVQNASNSPYVKLVSINSKKNVISGTVLVDIADKKGNVDRSEITVYDGMTLDDETGRDIYQGYRISEIRTGKEGYLTLETPSDTYYMKVGDVVGDIDPMLIQRHMIRRTIREHLDKGIIASQEIWSELHAEGYLEKTGKITKTLKETLFDGTFTVSEKFLPLQEQIESILRKSSGRLNINNADERKVIKYRKEVLNSPEFEALWQRICQKTLYRLAFDEDELIKSCTKSLSEMQPVAKAMVSFSKATIKQSQSGLDVKALSNGTTSTVIDVAEQPLPDILGVLQEKTGLTRRSLSTILKESGRLADFAKNPQQFISEAIGRINYCKRLSIVDGIKYYPLKGEVYAQSLFMDKELTGYARNLFETSSKSVYEYVPKDSEVESRFAQELEEQDEVKLYVKLPGWFKIPTPLGTYNPDWALVIEDNGEEHIYFVVETKSKHIGLGNEEDAKIACGTAHFSTLKAEKINAAKYVRATVLTEIMSSL